MQQVQKLVANATPGAAAAAADDGVKGPRGVHRKPLYNTSEILKDYTKQLTDWQQKGDTASSASQMPIELQSLPNFTYFARVEQLGLKE